MKRVGKEKKEGRKEKIMEGGVISGFTFECVPFVGKHNFFFLESSLNHVNLIFGDVYTNIFKLIASYILFPISRASVFKSFFNLKKI